MSQSKESRFKKPVRALGSMQQGAVESAVANDLNVEMIALHRISPDPRNPRSLGLDHRDPRNFEAADPSAVRKSEELARLEELALSISKQGLLQPITVYPYGQDFRIVAGERRYLAHVLIGAPSIKALILSGKPRNLRALQLIENLQREGLSLGNQLRGMRDVLAEYEANGEPLTSGDEFAAAIGRKRTTAYRWWALMHAPADVIKAVDDDLVGFVDASNLATITNIEERAVALSGLLRGKETAVAPMKRKRGKGRPALIRANLGTTTHLGVVRHIVSTLLGEHACAQTDWSDPKAVTARFKTLLRELEQDHA